MTSTPVKPAHSGRHLWNKQDEYGESGLSWYLFIDCDERSVLDWIDLHLVTYYSGIPGTLFANSPTLRVGVNGYRILVLQRFGRDC